MLRDELAPGPDADADLEGRPSAQSATRLLSSSELDRTASSHPAAAAAAGGWRERFGRAGLARWTLGIMLLLLTVFLWTVSNFMFSFMFSDNTYSKPFFVTYVDTSMFAISIIPVTVRYFYQHGFGGLWLALRRGGGGQPHHYHHPGAINAVVAATTVAAIPTLKMPDRDDDDDGLGAGERLLAADGDYETGRARGQEEREMAFEDPSAGPAERLTLRETALLSLQFCPVWFLANYTASACMGHTSVASATILTSTSSVWTLLLGALLRVEGYSGRKLAGVLASLAGVALISTADLTGDSDEHRGSFPHKSRGEVALGDSMALVSALVYGLYVVVMKRKVGSEDKVDMGLFFGLIGLFNVLLFWPGFVVLHYSGIETFEMPHTGKLWFIILINSFASFVSDISWAYAMLLTTPLVVTVGLSLTIPLSLIGEMIQYAQYSTWVYWAGAGVVFLSFVFINHESHDDDDELHQHHLAGEPGP